MAENRADPHARAPVQLTQDEIRVLKECRVNSLYYRGIPLGLVSALVAKGALDTGYFPFLKKWSRAVYFGVFSLGMFTGIASYKDTCFKKIMALENSSLKEQFIKFQRERGMFPNQQSEFAPVDEESTLQTDDSSHEPLALQTPRDEFESPLLNRMQEGKSWEQIRKNSTLNQQQQQQEQQDRPSSGRLTYEDLRKRNRPGFNTNTRAEDQESKEEPVEQKKPLDIESYTPITFTEDKSSRALDFSADNDSRMTSFRSDSYVPDKQTESESTKRYRGKNFPRPVRKNEYGDEIQ